MFPLLGSIGAAAPAIGGAGDGGKTSGVQKTQDLQFRNDLTTNTKAALDSATYGGTHGPVINVGAGKLSLSQGDAAGTTAGKGVSLWLLFILAAGAVAIALLLKR